MAMLKPAKGQTFKSGPIDTMFEVTSEMVGGRYCAVRQSIEPGQLFWPHVHANEDQVIVVLKGALGVRVGAREWSAGSGEIVYRPKGEPHAIWNAGTTSTEFIEITSPGNFEQYFLAQAEVAASGDAEKRSQLLKTWGISAVEGWEAELKAKYGLR
jgi:mannose-6-phosphate isomerase-like protein (cupin superfamily)